MINRIGDGSQDQAALAASLAIAGVQGSPDRARAEEPRSRVDETRKFEPDKPEDEDSDKGLKAARSILADLADPNVGVTFVKVEGVDDLVIRVMNRKTGEVVRQVPPDEVVEMKKRFAELLGMYKDLKA